MGEQSIQTTAIRMLVSDRDVPLLPPRLLQWIEEVGNLTSPKDVVLFLGSQEEREKIFEILEASHAAVRLNPEKRPGSFLAVSTPEDVARVEDKTYICTCLQEDAGPTNNWVDPQKMMAEMRRKFSKAMAGRTMYVVPFCMGPLDSPYARYGVEITDSPYVVANLAIMTRIDQKIIDHIALRGFVKCLHSVGSPVQEGAQDVPWPCNVKELAIAHFPELMEVWSYGSGYGGNALLNKKCFALRLASWMAKKEGWLAEHMLVIGVTNPQGVKRYFAASFPSACGKTNLAMLTSPLPGWKVECIGDDIAWMFWEDATGNLMAINPENGFFGVAPGTSNETNPNAMAAIAKNSLFTNVGRTEDDDVWWEGMGPLPSSPVETWLHEPYTPGKNLAAHPNSRFTAPIAQCPSLDPQWNAPQGVPISAIIFGGRRATTIPLVREAASWVQGVFYGASMTSEMTAAARGEVGKVRHDPFAMLPFCGYNMADYFAHWLSFSSAETAKRNLPRMYYVNWFLKGEDGEYLWPGFSQNMHVLRWIFERLEGLHKDAVSTPIGVVPNPDTFSSPQGVNVKSLFSIDPEKWCAELDDTRQYFLQFDPKRFPRELMDELDRERRLLCGSSYSHIKK